MNFTKIHSVESVGIVSILACMQGKPDIFIDYYDNLKEGDNWKHLSKVHEEITRNNLGLTKVRVFDILWWSYLRAKKRKQEQKGIKLSSIQW